MHRRSAAARTPLFASSGDPIADRRYDRAREHQEAGELPAAAELLVQALGIAPDFASAWFALGDIRERLQDRPGAPCAALRGRAARRPRLSIAVPG
ncbi:MAG: hypothetical protein ABSG76_22835 [Xanthobacteraceae bacterium]